MNYSAPYEENDRYKTGIVLKVLIVLFWIIQFWTTPYLRGEDFSKMNYNPLFGRLDMLLQEETLLGQRFALMEFILAALMIVLVKKYGIGWFTEQASRRLFFVSAFVIGLCFLNPNNSFDQLKYLFTYAPRILLLFLAMLFVFSRIKKEGFLEIMHDFIYYGFWVGLSQAVVSSLLFISGNGVKFLGSATTIPHAEIVNIMVIFSAIALSIYLSSHRKVFLLIVVIFHFTIFFADRRTPLAILLIIDLMILFYYRKTGTKLFFKSILAGGMLFLIYYFINKETAIDIEYFFLRIYAVFGGNIKEYGDNFTDMGHWEQTALTFTTLFSNFEIFWGGGMRNYMFFVAGQSAYIHNSFAAVWAYYGIPMTLFLFYLVFVFGKRSLQYLRESKEDYSRTLTAPVMFSYLMILVGDAFTGEYFSKHFVYAALFALILSFFRLDAEDEKRIYTRLIERRI